MSTHPCNREGEVVAALRNGDLDDELRTHVAGCAVCSETSFVASALRADARRAEREVELADPGRIWLDARLRARRLNSARAMRPIVIAQRVAQACTAAVAFVVAGWIGPELGRWLGWLRPPALDVASGFAFLQGILLLTACCGFLVIAAYALISAWRRP